MPRVQQVEPAYVDAVADIIETAGELRQASQSAIEAHRRWNDKQLLSNLTAANRADAYVGELTDRIMSRARRDDLNGAELLAIANQVLDGKLRLPEGVEVFA